MTPPTRASVLAATGEELDRLVDKVLCGVDGLIVRAWSREYLFTAENMAAIKMRIAARDLGPAFARELADQVLLDDDGPCSCDSFIDFTGIWAMLSAPPEAVCRAAVLACIGEG